MPQKTIIADEIYYPHANQLRILTDLHKYKVIVAGRRFGKSSMAINYALAWIMDETKPNQVVWIILPEYKQAKTIYWDDPDITSFFMPYVQAGFLKKNDSELSLHSRKTGSHLVLKGSDKPDSLRGPGLDLIIWDEVADIKPEAFNIITPSLMESMNHKVLYMGTPDGFNILHDLALQGDHSSIIEKAGKTILPDEAYTTFKFTSYDNLTWPEDSPERKSFIANLEKERQKYIEMGEEDWFEQEYMAAFRKRAGAVHKLFDRNLHVIENQIIPLEWKRFRGWDWGSSHPTASLRIAIDNDDNWFVEISYKQKDKYIEQHAEAIKAQDAAFLLPDNSDPISGYGDPSGAGPIKEFNRLGMHIVAAKRKDQTKEKTWIEFAIDKINSKIAPKKGHTVFLPNGRRIDDAPSFFILNTIENQMLVSELETLAYKKTDTGLQKTEIDDTADKAGHYDLHASLRYFAISTDMDVVWMPVIPAKPQVNPYATEPNIDLHNEELRKKAELEADLAIMRQAQRGY